MKKPDGFEEFDGYPMIPPEKALPIEEQERIIAESNERLKKLMEREREISRKARASH